MSDLRHLRPDLRASFAGYTRPPEPSGLLRAHMNEMGEDWPAAVKADWLGRLTQLPMHQYPEAQSELEARLEARLGAPPGGVLLGPSSGAIVDLIALAGLSPGCRVAMPAPGFSLYSVLAQRARAEVVQVPVGREFPLAGFLQAAQAGARQLWLTLPNNPTGSGVSGALAVAELAQQTAALAEPPLLVIDEAYAEFADCTYRLLPDRFPHVVLVRTLSKAFASAALRMGYAMGAPALLRALSRVQLPYSIPGASLAALEVALDHSAMFAARVRATRERASRLARMLQAGGYEVAETQANFVYVAGDHAAKLAAEQVLVRALPALGATRITVPTENVVGAAARALGLRAEPAPAQLPERPLLVLDIDGVLLDAESSFREAVRRALLELCPAAVWNPAYFRKLKSLGGFNNDFKLCAALVYLERSGRLIELKQSGFGFTQLELASIAREEPAIGAVVARHYIDTEQTETALITHAELAALGVSLAILTGRNPHELALAQLRLGFALEAVCDSATHLRKPEPAGLLQLADANAATRVVFVGDTVDDEVALVRARALRPEVVWQFCAVGPAMGELGAHSQANSILRAPTLRAALIEIGTFLQSTPVAEVSSAAASKQTIRTGETT